MKKVILISIDGMRPDGYLKCGNPFAEELMKMGTYTMQGRTVFPSVTLPCHMSMFHSVPPGRHGIMSNVYTPMVRPINGLMEQLRIAGKTCGFFYGWERLRDIARPGSLKYAGFVHARTYEYSDRMLAGQAIEYVKKFSPDFVFLYMVETDEKGGHDYGWMSKEYLNRISIALDNVKEVMKQCPEYTFVIVADHGGHDRMHGTDMEEDMTIPVILIGEDFEPGKEITDVSILDIAPTIAALEEAEPAPEWEGKVLF